MKREDFALKEVEGALFSRDWYTLMAKTWHNSESKANLRIHFDVEEQS